MSLMEIPTLSGRRASQHPEELYPLIDLFKKHNVRRYLEIGARHGDTFHAIMSALPAQSFGVAVDLVAGPWGTSKSLKHLRIAGEELTNSGRRVQIVIGNSRSPKIIERVAAFAPFDAILIDGDHRYDGVKADWLNYGSMAPIIAFHDIAGEGQMTKDGKALPVEVPRFWNEIKGGFEHVEFIGTDTTMGVGVILKGKG
jgi:cephalosporin hydroxylase